MTGYIFKQRISKQIKPITNFLILSFLSIPNHFHYWQKNVFEIKLLCKPFVINFNPSQKVTKKSGIMRYLLRLN